MRQFAAARNGVAFLQQIQAIVFKDRIIDDPAGAERTGVSAVTHLEPAAIDSRPAAVGIVGSEDQRLGYPPNWTTIRFDQLPTHARERGGKGH